MIKFLDLNKQYYSIKSEIDEAISNVINESAFIGGKYVKKFEEEFAEYHNANYCIGVGNGTDALEIAIESLSLPQNSEIIVPANSFIASSEAITRSGHKVVFCGFDKDNYTICPECIKKCITEKTKAIIAVHLYGHPCDMDEILNVANERDLRVIEDCAQAHGAEYKNQKVGVLGDIGTFSFYPGKNLGAYGDAGAIVTNSEELALKCRKIANHGRVQKYNHEFEGRNSRLDGLQAAILSVKLRHLDEWTTKRIEVADTYLDQLKQIDELKLPKREKWAKQVYHLFVVRTEKRDLLVESLKKNEIQTGIHYPILLPLLNAYDYLKDKEWFDKTKNVGDHLLSLPIGEHISFSEQEFVISEIKKFFQIK